MSHEEYGPGEKTVSVQMRTEATCPKHGKTEYVIESTIPGHEGVWCQLCWLESLGPSLPYRKVRHGSVQD
jgi:hypothetical protein